MLSVFARSGKRTGSSNKPRRMNLERERFLALLRAGLWNKPTDLPSSDKPIHWANIMSMATRQTVIGLVANAIAQLPEAEKPDQQRIAQLQALLVRNHQAHQRLNRQLVETVSLLRENDLRPILLKGQGIAQLYSNPFLRQCGDIDLYIGPEDFEKARELIEQHYGKDPKNHESVKHYHAHYQGLSIELHRIAERLANPIYNNRFQAWTLPTGQSDIQQSVPSLDPSLSARGPANLHPDQRFTNRDTSSAIQCSLYLSPCLASFYQQRHWSATTLRLEPVSSLVPRHDRPGAITCRSESIRPHPSVATVRLHCRRATWSSERGMPALHQSLRATGGKGARHDIL